MNEALENQIQGMSEFFYRQWYEENVKHNLTEPEREKLLKKLSDYSLYNPFGVPGVEIPLKEFPELAKFANTKTFSGIQLYVVMTQIFEEFHKDKITGD